MASLIPGYEYDIFISYRQKDNKHDGWVTEFVDNLKGELESTFKEEISVYFDINPHDGLLETHDVNASLKDKLKCLVFIPVISQTYCDSKSYAWQHEFVTFHRMAKEDQFGRDIKLLGGNVANRILPVKIHDLDPEDKILLENELGGVLRCIEFIYKSAGVNRPLRANEDHPKDNLNKSYYRDQINKVANAVKEIITSIKKLNQQGGEVPKEVVNVKPEKANKLTPKIIISSVILLALIVFGYFFVAKLSKPKEQPEKSIAVLPFRNLSNDTTQLYFSDGIVEAILDHLFKVGDLKVISSTSTKRYRDTELSIKEIASELGVASVLEGSVQKIGNNVRITAQLIEAKTDVHLWSETYDRNISDIFAIQTEVAQNVAKELKATLTSEEKEQTEKNQTRNPDAYNLYLQGRFFWNKRTEEGLKKSIEYFKQAIALDEDYALAIAGLADAYSVQAFWGWSPVKEGYAKAKELTERALKVDNKLAEAHATMGNILCYSEWKWEDARKELLLAIELNPKYATAHQYYSELLDVIGQNEEARIQINLALEFDPYNLLLHNISVQNYYHEGNLNKSLEECLEMQELDPDYGLAYLWSFFIYIRQREDIKAVEALRKMMSLNTISAKHVDEIKDIYNKSRLNGLINWLIELNIKMNVHILYVADSNFYLAKLYAMVDRKENAIDWLEKSIENRSKIAQINNDPDFDNLRSEPGFQELIKKMGLSEYQKPK